MKTDRISPEKAVVGLGEKVNVVNSMIFKDIMQDLYDDGVKYIEVDFTGTKNIDSSCLGKMLLFQKKLKEREGELQIINITSEHIRKWFNMIQLEKVISYR